MSEPRPSAVVYLAGPIDDITVEEAFTWRAKIAEDWPDILFYNPVGAIMNGSHETAPAADTVNRAVIRASTILLANLTGPGRGFGTVREIEYASSLNHVLVAVAGDLDRTMMKYDLIVKETVNEALTKALETLTDFVNQRPSFMVLPLPPREEED